MEISTIGIDLSKTSFHAIGLNARVNCVAEEVLPQATDPIHFESTADADRYGGLWRSALSRSCPSGSGARRQTDARAVCEAV